MTSVQDTDGFHAGVHSPILDDSQVKQKRKRIVDTDEYISSLVELIKEGREVSLPIVGSSMTPFLGDGRDQIFLKSPSGPIRRGDIVLYRRRDGTYILHRVYRVRGRGDAAVYDMIGDSQDRVERGIQRYQIQAVAFKARRKGKIIEPEGFYWWFFRYIWIRIIPLRRTLMRLYAVNIKNNRARPGNGGKVNEEE